jgi:hypothetical protein
MSRVAEAGLKLAPVTGDDAVLITTNIEGCKPPNTAEWPVVAGGRPAILPI